MVKQHGKTAAVEVIEDRTGEGTLWLVYLPSSMVQENNNDFPIVAKATSSLFVHDET
jgi:hypothetical protein